MISFPFHSGIEAFMVQVIPRGFGVVLCGDAIETGSTLHAGLGIPTIPSITMGAELVDTCVGEAQKFCVCDGLCLVVPLCIIVSVSEAIHDHLSLFTGRPTPIRAILDSPEVDASTVFTLPPQFDDTGHLGLFLVLMGAGLPLEL